MRAFKHLALFSPEGLVKIPDKREIHVKDVGIFSSDNEMALFIENLAGTIAQQTLCPYRSIASAQLKWTQLASRLF